MEFVKRHPLLTIFGTVAIIGVLAFFIARGTETVDELSLRALRNHQRGYLAQAKSDIERALSIDPNDEQSVLVAASIAMEEGDLEKAREIYYRVETPRMLEQHTAFGESSIFHGHVELAEEILMGVRERRPDHARSRVALLQIYRITYRYAEHRRLLLELVAVDDPARNDIDFLFGLFNSYNSKEIETRAAARDLTVSDNLVRLTACVNHIQHESIDPARDALQQLIIDRPDLIEARALLGLLLVRLEDDTELLNWFMDLPPEALEHPDCCYAAGMTFENLESPADALACYRQALSVDYRHQPALDRLTALLDSSQEAARQQLQEISARQTEFRELLKRQSPNAMDLELPWGKSGLDMLVQLGWLPEAKAWFGLFTGEDAEAFAVQRDEVEARLKQANEDPGAERDWPAIAPIMRSLDLPEPANAEWLQNRQATLRDG